MEAKSSHDLEIPIKIATDMAAVKEISALVFDLRLIPEEAEIVIPAMLGTRRIEPVRFPIGKHFKRPAADTE